MLKRKGLCIVDNKCNTKAGGDALSTLAHSICADGHATYQTDVHRRAQLGSKTQWSK